jgi:predicted phage-related endonuclease
MSDLIELGHDFWAAPLGWDYPPGYPRAHPGVWADDALEVLPPGLDGADPELWRAWRLTGIGSSDISALLGLHRRKAAMEVWEIKTGRASDDLSSFDDGDAYTTWQGAEYGVAFEPAVRDMYAAKHGLTIVKPGTFRSKRWPWLVVNPDGLIQRPPGRWPAADGEGPAEGYEGKTCSMWLADQWADGSMPDHAELQCQTVMAVLGLAGMHVRCCIGGQWSADRYVLRDDSLIEDIVELTREFWYDHVLTDTPPPPDGGLACEEFLTRRHLRAAEGAAVLADPDAAEFILAAYAQEKAAKSYVDGGREGKNLARDQLGDFTELVDDDGRTIATWRQNGNLRLDDLLAECPDETGPFMVKREVLDVDAFAEAHPDLYARYRARRLLIKTVKTTTKENHDG